MQLNHLLQFQGQAEQAFNFYKSIFGGEFSYFSRFGDVSDQQLSEEEKQYVMHVSLPINTYTELMGCDIPTSHLQTTPFQKGNNHFISINLEHDQADLAKRLFIALSRNGIVEIPFTETFWNALYGSLTDQFGIKWVINCQLGSK